MKFEKYKKEEEISYTFGAFPTFELVKNKSGQVVCIIVSSKLNKTQETEKLFSLAKEKNIEIVEDDKAINKLSDKENCFIIGVFKKYYGTCASGKHLVLVNPSDMGNMGTIFRTALGFGFTNICIVKPCVDIFNPKVVRASMGAIFSLNVAVLDSVEEYLKSNNNKKYFFMLLGTKKLGEFKHQTENYDLVFGNEASGLPNELLNYDESIVIEHSNKIDSLNLPISVGIALYEFSKK